jgi:SAM-dependent methyltransferase
VVEALAPRAGERFLDVACGTGGVALVAARAGAEVTGLDISAEQLEKARVAASKAGLAIRLDEGDAQQLPYGDATFDAVASAFGIIFAPDRHQAAAELARVTRPGGRVVVTSWTDDDWAELSRSVGRESPTGGQEYMWGREDAVRESLGDAFELRFEDGEWHVSGDSPEAIWELMSTSAPPLKAFLEGLDDERREQARQRYVEFFGSGELRRRYVLVLGTRQ